MNIFQSEKQSQQNSEAEMAIRAAVLKALLAIITLLIRLHYYIQAMLSYHGPLQLWYSRNYGPDLVQATEPAIFVNILIEVI